MQEQTLNNFFAGEHLEAGSPIAAAMSAVFGETTKKHDEIEKMLGTQYVLDRPCAQGSSTKYTFYVVVLHDLVSFYFEKKLFELCLKDYPDASGETFTSFDKALLYYLRSIRKGNLTEEAVIIAGHFQWIVANDRANAARIPMF